MKPQILAVKPALAGPNATAFTSRMTKIQDSRIWAYGGAFCLSVPITSSLECGFYPEPVLAFFNRDREGATFTEKDGYLIMKHGKVQERTRLFPSQIVPTLQAIGRKIEITEQIEHLDVLAKLCRNNTADFSQGAWFQNSMVFAMYGRAVCFSTNGLFDGHPNFGLPSDSVEALSRIKSPLTHFVSDQQCVQFEFEDGTWLASRTLGGLEPPNFMSGFEGYDDPGRFQEITFHEGIAEEVLALKLYGERKGQMIDMLWWGEKRNLFYRSLNPLSETDEDLYNTGVFEDAYAEDIEFRIKGEAFRIVLALQPESVGIMRRNVDLPAQSLNGYGTGFAVAACLSRE